MFGARETNCDKSIQVTIQQRRCSPRWPLRLRKIRVVDVLFPNEIKVRLLAIQKCDRRTFLTQQYYRFPQKSQRKFYKFYTLSKCEVFERKYRDTLIKGGKRRHGRKHYCKPAKRINSNNGRRACKSLDHTPSISLLLPTAI